MDRRPSASKRGYGQRWRNARATFLRQNPWCRLCAERGEQALASVVDHINPHRGDRALFWAKDNWQSLCEHCHNSVKKAQEQQEAACDAKGYPVAYDHHWNRP